MHIKKLPITKAFTLIELLVVMVIIGIILGVSVAGFRVYQANTSLQSSLNDFTTTFRNMRNSAQNNSVYRGSTSLYWTYFYGFKIEGSKLKPFMCRTTTADQVTPDPTNGEQTYIQTNVSSIAGSGGSSITCPYLDNDIKDLGKISLSNTCQNIIIFQSVTGIMTTGTGSDCKMNITVDNQTKLITFTNNSAGDFKVQ